jgi:hypothetical protein
MIDWSKVDNAEPVFQRFPSRRSIVYGTKGVVSSSNPLATEAGLEILRQGGNAGTEKPLVMHDVHVADFGVLNNNRAFCSRRSRRYFRGAERD